MYVRPEKLVMMRHSCRLRHHNVLRVSVAVLLWFPVPISIPGSNYLCDLQATHLSGRHCTHKDLPSLAEKKNMKLAKPSLPGIGMLFAAVLFLSISMSAQQEVNPDHFDDNPVVTKKSKPAPRPAKQVAAKKPSAPSGAALNPKAAPAQHEPAKSSAAPVQTASNR